MKETRRPELSIDEQKLEAALQGQQLWNCEVDELKKNLLFIYTLVGLRGENYPAGRDKDFLHTYILENYGGHTGKELRLAFQMAIQGKLDADHKHYENFSVAYFSEIMDAYRRWAADAAKQLPVKLIENPIPKWAIECEYCYVRQQEINKLPIKFKK